MNSSVLELPTSMDEKEISLLIAERLELNDPEGAIEIIKSYVDSIPKR